MAPKKVFVIRHCDKPEKDDDGMCNLNGYKRATKLANFWGSCKPSANSCQNDCVGTKNTTDYWSTILDTGEKPTHLLAAISKGQKKGCTPSNRCCLILNPTAYSHGLIINEKGESYCDFSGEDMANYILKNYSSNDIVIVAWEHKNIPKLINSLGINPKLGDWPKDASDRFDLVFKIDFSTSKPTLSILTKNFGLPGDDNNDPFNYSSNKKNNSLTTVQQQTNKKKNNVTKIIIISVGIILSITLICIIIYFIKKRSKK